MADRKFYRQIVEMEVLTEDEPLDLENVSPMDVDYLLADANVGNLTEISCEEIDSKTMASLLLGQGCSSKKLVEFYRLDQDGNDLDDEEYHRFCEDGIEDGLSGIEQEVD
jgi:hypothetical protein